MNGGVPQPRHVRVLDDAWDPIVVQTRSTETENRPSTLPTWTFAASAAERLGNPSTCSRDLSGGGPPGISRARDQLLHGVPNQTVVTRPALIHPTISYCNRFETKSRLPSFAMSISKIATPFRR